MAPENCCHDSDGNCGESLVYKARINRMIKFLKNIYNMCNYKYVICGGQTREASQNRFPALWLSFMLLNGK